MRSLLPLLLLCACGESAEEPIEHALSWLLAGAECRDIDAARVELEAGGLGLLAHGPCEQAQPLRLALPSGERQLRALLFDREDRLVAQGQAELPQHCFSMPLAATPA